MEFTVPLHPLSETNFSPLALRMAEISSVGAGGMVVFWNNPI
jgi:hypothetical protein